MGLEGNWRLLDFETEDPRMSLAVGESVFRNKKAGLSPDTLYLWRTVKPVILFPPGSRRELPESAKKGGVESLRTLAVAGHASFCDSGNINFSIALDSRTLNPLIEGEYQPLRSEYRFLMDAFTEGLRGLGMEIKAKPDGIYTEVGNEIATSQPAWLSDILLFQGTVYVSTELKNIRFPPGRAVTSLTAELGRSLLPEEIIGILIQGFERKLNVTLEKSRLTGTERKLAEKLYDCKYSTDKWHFEGKAPFLSLTGETLVALYVANPPTSKCRQLIDRVNKAASSLMDEVKVVAWRRGLGTEQNPAELTPPVLVALAKANILPAVIINGEVKFALEVPSENILRAAIHNPDRFPDLSKSLHGLRR